MTAPGNYRYHGCPAPWCEALVPHRHFACPRDWAILPKDKQAAILDGYTEGALSEAHVAAMTNAMAWYRDERDRRTACRAPQA